MSASIPPSPLLFMRMSIDMYLIVTMRVIDHKISDTTPRASAEVKLSPDR